ncbi:hypothetical protein RFI_05551 [Reticulomyxa filosa]|uniref:Protein kinase domain-containing protein n=1 Tax=Reticulomyxa filosa TaxID=46433 RepID=X6P0A7_RETFI|nr:hypothetical protein RFI_05551 [Reticulomyxa filosa]|eukprot:ETO31573.1 hypothetical protein RFI_05551 [Reticulomyxa filosa]
MLNEGKNSTYTKKARINQNEKYKTCIFKKLSQLLFLDSDALMSVELPSNKRQLSTSDGDEKMMDFVDFKRPLPKHNGNQNDVTTSTVLDGPSVVDPINHCASNETDESTITGGTRNTTSANGKSSATTLEVNVEMEIAKIRSVQITKSLQEIAIEEESLEYRKKMHIKFVRLMNDEKKSKFNDFPILHDRYLFLTLLGKGGFSEVYKAYDLLEHRIVACKIHQLNVQWTDERKKNYTRHAAREYDIHKKLNHCRIVQLFDVFGIDINSFCTVLEYCDGMDLDHYLKMHQHLTEKEARSIMIQLFEGLSYLQSQEQPIIHYDLKPANILYKNGHIQLTDFGLAKIMESDTYEMELTSQGAGTYWYLPPECFSSSSSPPMISPKVDIWSAGIIFYQMLYSRRPFGDDISQENLLKLNTILQANKVEFPSKPPVSAEAKVINFLKIMSLLNLRYYLLCLFIGVDLAMLDV